MSVAKVNVVNLSDNELPKYADMGSSGVDLRADLTKINSKFLFNSMLEEDHLVINPGGRALIPTGLHTSFDPEYELQVRARSGLALKYGVMVTNGLGTIDSSYVGDIGVILTNTGTEQFIVHQGDRIAQAILTPVVKIMWNELDSLDQLEHSERGEGGFGHSGVK